MNCRIIGIGSYVPEQVVDNQMISEIVDTSDEWIVQRTGIQSRRIIDRESVLDLGVKASLSALDDAGINSDELDLILCSTLQGDYVTPALACLIQGEIGANCAAFDINAACPGFVYALDVANAYVASGKAQHILVVCAETLSRHVDWQDRATCVLFGDAAGAAVVTAGKTVVASRLTCTTDQEALYSRAPQGNCPFSHQETGTYVKMMGQDVYKFAVSAVSRDFKYLSEEAGLTVDDIDYFILHQANKRIIDAVRQRLKQPREKFPTNVERYGNSSSASIPVLLDELDKKGVLENGHTLFISAFGSGLSTGSYIIKWNK
ncbi:MAG: beta-ketoacyl-ACP synthase III [Bacillota bacterium]|jgi:3-oxoacyl-[acyl-carrier-protein] synthase-3